MKKNEKFESFLRVCKLLNTELSVTPLLHGSCGLEVLTGHNFNADDVDILVPKEFIFEKWDILKVTLEKHCYQLIDLHEHTFLKDGVKISFYFIENLCDYAEIDVDKIETKCIDNCSFKLLSIQQYIQLYETSARDEYRIKHGKNEKDLAKLNFLKKETEK